MVIVATEAYAILWITGQTLTPVEISSRVGLEADKTWTKGERRITYEGYNGPPIYEKASRWKVQSTIAREEPIEAHVTNLMERIAPFSEGIRALADENDVTFACVIYADSEDNYNPEVFLSSSAIDFLSTLGASFWVDFYFLSDAEN